VIAAFDASPGAGVASVDGRMLDRPHYRTAQRVLARAQQGAERPIATRRMNNL
jgi:citrate lyase subunit beta/citryl-CoA lyase